MVRSLWRDVEEPRQEMDDIMNMLRVLGAHRDVKDGIFHPEPCAGVRNLKACICTECLLPAFAF